MIASLADHGASALLLAMFEGVKTQHVTGAAAVIIITFLVLNMRRRRSRHTAPGRRSEQDASTHAESIVELRPSLNELMVQLEELSRRINAQIDTKFARLEQSIADADRRIAALRVLIDAAKHVGTDAGESGPRHAPEAASGDQPDAKAPVPGKTPPQPQDERYKAVYELADQGLSPVEISQRLGQRPGEVELILNIRPRDTESRQPPA